MITYFYWALIALVALGALWTGAGVLRKPLLGTALGGLVLLAGWLAYSFHFQQIFVKRWGGVMHISVPKGHHHIGATWKDENLWVENYDPQTNTCEFREYSKGNVLEGTVIIKDCNPLMPSRP